MNKFVHVCDKTVSHLTYTCMTRSFESSLDWQRKIPAVTLCRLCRSSCLYVYSFPWKRRAACRRHFLWSAQQFHWNKPRHQYDTNILAVLFRRHTSDHPDKKVCYCESLRGARRACTSMSTTTCATITRTKEANVTASPSAACGCLVMNSLFNAHVSVSGDKMYSCCTVCNTFIPKKAFN